MRCRSCNCALSSREATRKSVVTGEYLDLCNSCLDEVPADFEYEENPAVPDDDAEQELDLHPADFDLITHDTEDTP